MSSKLINRSPNLTEILGVEKVARMKRLYDEGWSFRRLAKEFECSGVALKKLFIREFNISHPPKLKRIFNEEELTKIRCLYKLGWGTRRLSEEMGCARKIINEVLDRLNIIHFRRKFRQCQNIITERKCRECKIIFPIENFWKRIRKNGRTEYSYNCEECAKKLSRIRNKNIPKEKRRQYNNKYESKDTTKQIKQQYRERNKERIIYRNKIKIAQRNKEKPWYVPMEKIGGIIKRLICQTTGKTYNNSCLKQLPFTISQLKEYLENQFEPWMNWNNYGLYKPRQLNNNWDDNNQDTWTWCLDHIIPHMDFKYITLEDDNFKKCWDITNLRPFHAKQKRQQYDIIMKAIYKKKKRESDKIYRKKIKKDPSIYLKLRVSAAIWRCLKKNGGSKFGESCLQYLGYTISDLHSHLEKLFEPWMNWNNYGVYRRENWNDHDSTTWTWQIDHIIPQADLPYASMKEPNFLKSWSLSNLRPYSSKQNFLDGITRVRHKKKGKCDYSKTRKCQF